MKPGGLVKRLRHSLVLLALASSASAALDARVEDVSTLRVTFESDACWSNLPLDAVVAYKVVERTDGEGTMQPTVVRLKCVGVERDVGRIMKLRFDTCPDQSFTPRPFESAADHHVVRITAAGSWPPECSNPPKLEKDLDVAVHFGFKPSVQLSTPGKPGKLDVIDLDAAVASHAARNPAQISVRSSLDGVDWSRRHPSRSDGVGANGSTLQLPLRRPLPVGKKVRLRVSLPSPQGGEEKIVAGSVSVPAAPTGRKDKRLGFLLDLAYVDEGGLKGGARDSEALLDFVLRREFRLGTDSANWARRSRVDIDVAVGSDDPDESKAQNKVRLGGGFLWHHSRPRDGQDVWENRFGLSLAHLSDRDFSTRDLVLEASWSPVHQRWLMTEDRRIARFRSDPQRRTATPRLRAWTFEPVITLSRGKTLSAPSLPIDVADGGSSLPVEDDGEVLRARLDLNLVLQTARVEFSLQSRLHELLSPVGATRVFGKLGVAWRITRTQSVGLTYSYGRDAPTFEKVDSRSIAWRWRR